MTEARLDALRDLMPEVFGDGRVDWQALRRALGAAIDDGPERFGLSWPGKSEAQQALLAPSAGRLAPAPERGVDDPAGDNLLIEGDNLEVLKLLLASHRGAFKLIYLDPPYNTGHEFIYRDNFRDGLAEYLRFSRQADAQGRAPTDAETDGRFHARWLSLMYPRLVAARALLRDDGLIAVSIDDHELATLRLLMNEVFGEECFVANIIVQSNKRGQTYKQIAKTHEYLVLFARAPHPTLFELDKAADALPFVDRAGPYDLWELRNRNPKFGRFNRPNLHYPIHVNPDARDATGWARVALEPAPGFSVTVHPRNRAGVDGCWRWGRDAVLGAGLGGDLPDVVARQKKDGGWNIYERARKVTTKARSIWTDTEVISERGTRELAELGLGGIFDHPKPLGLMTRLLRLTTRGDDRVLDFFAGSGTTGHAVLAQNAQDGGARRFVLVQLPEPTGRADFPTISRLAEERLRRAIASVGTGGFRVMTLGE